MPIETAVITNAAVRIGSSLLSQLLRKPLASLLDNREQRKQIESCINDLSEQWLIAVIKSLDAIDYGEQAIRDLFSHYSRALEQFVKAPDVSEELLKPLTEATSQYRIDCVLLRQHWLDMELQALPEEFDWDSIVDLYIRRVQKQSVVSKELRGLYLAQLNQDQSNYLQAIRGVWPDFELVQYQTRMTSRYQALDLSAMMPPSRDDIDNQPLLKDVFIAPNVKHSTPPKELPKELWQRRYQTGELNELPEDFTKLHDIWHTQPVEPVLNILDQQKLIVLGDPGSGKSTLVRYLLLSCLNPPSHNPNWLLPLKACLPLLIELRLYVAACENQNCNNFLEYLHYLGKSEGYAINHQALKEQLKTRPSLMLFDGLDEIFDLALREKISQEIIGYSHDFPKAHVLITSRIIGYQGTAFRAVDFKEYTLQDLNTAQINAFAQGWFTLAFRDHPQEIASRVQRITKALENSPAIAQLAGNPLLLTMLAIIAKHAELPRERVLLYDHAARVLCHHWDVTGHHIKDGPADYMRESDKLDLLRRIAWKMQETGGLKGNALGEEELQTEIDNYLKQRWHLSETDARRTGLAIRNQLRERNFILCFYGARVYGFVHRTFLEYFCATEIKHRFDRRDSGAVDALSFEDLKKLYLAHFCDDSWHEILRLLCGLIDAKFAGQLIDAIVPKRSYACTCTYQLTIAVQYLSEIENLNLVADTARRVLESICGWFESPDAHRFRDHDDEKYFVEEALPAIERIGKTWIGREYLINWIKSPNKSVRNESGIQSFSRLIAALCSDHPEIEVDLLNLAQTPKNLTITNSFYLKYMAFDALARSFYKSTKKLLHSRLPNADSDNDSIYLLTLKNHYLDDPETYTLLKQCLVNEEGYNDGVLSILGEYFSANLETYNLVKASLINGDLFTRSLSIDILAERYSDNTETYLLIKTCLSDKSYDIRESSIKALVRYFGGHGETYALIKHGLQDEHPNVREVSIYALANHYSQSAELQQLITPFLQDTGMYVRKAAIWVLNEHIQEPLEICTLLKICLHDQEAKIRSYALKLLAKIYFEEDIYIKLLSKIFPDIMYVDPLETITSTRVEEAAKQFNLSVESIREHYESINQQITLILEWQTSD